MALEQIFRCPKTLARLQNGPLCGLLEGFCLWLKKTCCKHGVSFWEYLKDRVSGKNLIPSLTEYIRQAAHSRM